MNISIITCTYNPEEKILSKVLEAVSKLTIPVDCKVEYVIIDNNSNPPLIETGYVKDFLRDIAWSRIYIEKEQGLSSARLRGFNESSGDIIVFFDDDNVADPNYLIEVKQLFENNVQVGAWGPGDIDVVFTDPVPQWVNDSTRGIFQEKENKLLEFGYSLNPSSFHPFGTGLSLRRDVVEFYYNQVLTQGFTVSGRKGKSLTGADDTQLLYAAYKKGLATGVAPALKMKHLIPAKRTTINYICKLLYGSYSTGDTAFVESFPEYKKRIVAPSSGSVIKNLGKKILSISAWKNKNKFKMNIAAYMGIVIGKYKALNMEIPGWINKIVVFLELES